MARLFYILFFVTSRLLLPSLAQEINRTNERCPSFICGGFGSIGFPFSNGTHPECGLLVVENCSESGETLKTIQLGTGGPKFYITGISEDETIRLHNLSVQIDHHHVTFDNHSCKSFENFFQNLTLPVTSFLSFEFPFPQVVWKCQSNQSIPTDLTLACNDSKSSIIYYNHTNDLLPNSKPQCPPIPFQMLNKTQSVEFLNLFTGWFYLRVLVRPECYRCHRRGGKCQSDSKGNFLCAGAPRGEPTPRGAPRGDGKLGWRLGLRLGITATGIGMLILLAFCFRKMLLSKNSMIFLKKRSENYQNIEAFLRNHGSLGPKRYNYSDIKKMTNSFKHKLGQGGFGGVYKGKLLDGRDVAVKVLKEAKGSGEEFINEVASVSRTSHVNIVTLFGFCFEGSRRALIYEYVPNGSLDKFIYEKTPLETTNKLKWETLYQIAVGIARGLEYLHRGCSTRIFHFDIKPHNILLDKDFCPKISDFGLAKICPQKESVISMTGARGTIGYIAPEVFCRNIGEVSHKSDVYSYGMMVLEMVGGRKNINVEVDHTSEIYFPHWIYNRLELDEELQVKCIANEDDEECARKMIIVSLWCIQTNPSDRPTMSRVVDMLGGSLDSLQIPPKPYLSSPRSRPALSVYESRC